MLSIGRFRRFAREWLGAALGLLVLAIAATAYLRTSRPVRAELTITAGSPEGLRHRLAERLAASARRHGMRLRVVATSGSIEALDRVDDGSIDLALVQGGLDTSGRSAIEQVASLKIEPLHLLVKSEIEPQGGDGEARGLEFLRGRVVNLSEPGSGTYDLAREVLAFAGLKAPEGKAAGDYTATTLGYAALHAEPDRARLPDAVFTVSGLPSPLVRYLVTRRDYRLVPLRFGEAFALDALHDSTPSTPAPSPRGLLDGVDRLHVYPVEIPAYTYSVSPPIPPRPVPTFGTRLLAVANARVASRAVERLLEAGCESGPGGRAFDPTLLDLAPEYDWHDGAIAFRDRNKPLIIGDAVDFLEKWTSLLGGVLGGVFFLWQWVRQRNRRRRELGFESYMLKVTAIERQALRNEGLPHFDLDELLRLQAELGELKNEALQRFADGEFEGEALFSGFVNHVNDARDHLTRLILHEREIVDRQAARQRRAAEFEPTGAHPEPGGRSDGEAIGP